MDTGRLDWTDSADEQANARGFLGTIDPCVIHTDAGRVAWDAERWAFLDGDAPETVNPSLWRQSQLTRQHGLFEVTEGIYQVRGFDISNMTIIEGQTGVVIIDPLTTAEPAAAALALYREHRGDRPVRAVIFTHSHADHFGGVNGVLAADESVEIVAPEGFLEHAVSENVIAGPAMLWRSSFMYGRWLDEGPAGSVGFGLGQAVSGGTPGLRAPTHDVTHTGEVVVLDGVTIEFQLTPDTEAPAELNLYLPDFSVLLVAENASHTLHNVLTLRGALIRDAKRWAGYLTETIQLFGARSEILIGSHHWPTWGQDSVVRLLSEQRDAYAYLHDQTVRLMNQGYVAAEIAEQLTEFPGQLGSAWHARGYYGSLSHNSKAVYQRYMGWYDGNPAHLWPHPPAESGRRYVELLGGPDAVVSKAQAAYDEGDLRWVAELLDHVVQSHPDHAAARELLGRTYEQLAFGAENGVWRNFYLSAAAELRGLLDQQINGERRAGGRLAGLNAGQLFDVLSIRIDGPRAADTDVALSWTITDDRWTISLCNGVLTAVRGDLVGTAPRAEVSSTIDGLRAVVSGEPVPRILESGTLQVTGDVSLLDTLASFIEQPAAGFPIATPRH